MIKKYFYKINSRIASKTFGTLIQFFWIDDNKLDRFAAHLLQYNIFQMDVGNWGEKFKILKSAAVHLEFVHICKNYKIYVLTRPALLKNRQIDARHYMYSAFSTKHVTNMYSFIYCTVCRENCLPVSKVHKSHAYPISSHQNSDFNT
jgi:hypothetical protein